MSQQYSSIGSKKNTMPLRSDRLLFHLFKALLGALFMGIFLFIILPSLKDDTLFSEITIIIIVMIVSDIMGMLFARYFVFKINKRYGYDSRGSNKIEMKKYIQYTLYVLLRVLFFIFGIFKAISNSLMDIGVYYLFAILISCILINLINKMLSWLIVHITFL